MHAGAIGATPLASSQARRRHLSAALRDSILEAQAERLADALGGIGAARRAVRDAMDVPPFGLPVARLVAGGDGSVWVERADSRGEPPEGEWLVLDSGLSPLARVRLPPEAAPLWVEGREVWGVEHDALDVPTVVRWRVVEGGEATGLEARPAEAIARTVQLRALRWFARRGLLDPATVADMPGTLAVRPTGRPG